jgi:hypothetical protein
MGRLAQGQEKETEMIGNARRILGVSALAASAAVAGLASADPGATTGRAPSAAFERLRGLAGEWVAAEDGEMSRKGDLVARYAVTAGGSAVVETVFPGSPHEMVTVYHADGPDLVLTHYCVEGNQPRMRARAAKGSRFDFEFDGGTGIDPRRDRHMHSATVELVGSDEIRTVWTELAEAKPVLVVESHLVRKAR